MSRFASLCALLLVGCLPSGQTLKDHVFVPFSLGKVGDDVLLEHALTVTLEADGPVDSAFLTITRPAVWVSGGPPTSAGQGSGMTVTVNGETVRVQGGPPLEGPLVELPMTCSQQRCQADILVTYDGHGSEISGQMSYLLEVAIDDPDLSAIATLEVEVTGEQPDLETPQDPPEGWLDTGLTGDVGDTASR